TVWISQLLYHHKGTVQTRIELYMSNVISPLPINTQWYSRDHFAGERINHIYILISPINDIALIWVRRSARYRDKNQVINLVICYAIWTIVGCKFYRSYLHRLLINRVDNVIIGISSIDFVQICGKCNSCDLWNRQKVHNFLLLCIENNDIAISLGISIRIKLRIYLLLHVRARPCMCNKQ